MSEKTEMSAEEAIDATIEKGLVRIVYQPIVDLRTGEIFAHEALARPNPDMFSGPLELFSAAVRAQRVGRLGRLLRGLSVENCPGVPLFLNIHPGEFGEGWLVRPDDPIFSHDSRVFLEITESVPISHYEFCHSVLEEVRSKGISLVVDDLGAGYSNLKYIADLTPEVVKLDRELIMGLVEQSRLFRLCKALVRLCNDLNAKVVCEGIETEEELQAVIATGAHFGQGYFLARPAYPAPAVSWRPHTK
jgi:EAL domain-containing protein (putative c-di-GMP-specific phosphodiesterase class I)